MTEKDIQNILGKEQVLKGHNPVASNIKYLIDDWELDLISLTKTGYLFEFEIKINYQDFKKDLLKKKHYYYKMNYKTIPNYFYYVCTEKLINVNEIPFYTGLIYVINNKSTIIKKAPLVHNMKFDKLKLMEKICKVNSERQYLGCCLLTYKNNLIKNAK